MRFLVLTTDAYGGVGGIALYNRDVIGALCSYPLCKEVVVLPRLMPGPPETFPPRLSYVTSGVGGKFKYTLAVLKTLLKNPQFDLIVCGHINLLPLAYLAHLYTGAPLCLEIYGIDAWQPTRSRSSNYLVGKVERFIAISRVTQQRFLAWAKLPESKVLLLPNAIHLELYGIAPKNPVLLARYQLNHKKVLMTLGRMVGYDRYKGFDEVLEVLPSLLKHEPSLVYLAIGDGSDRPRLLAKAAELGLAGQVLMPGYVAEEEKAAHYRLADVYVMPSRGEGFGFVLLEALACGVPVIASHADGTKEAVRDGLLGQLVEPGDHAQLQAAIETALAQPKTIPPGLDYFAYPNFTRRLHELVAELLPGRAGDA